MMEERIARKKRKKRGYKGKKTRNIKLKRGIERRMITTTTTTNIGK